MFAKYHPILNSVAECLLATRRRSSCSCRRWRNSSSSPRPAARPSGGSNPGNNALYSITWVYEVAFPFFRKGKREEGK